MRVKGETKHGGTAQLPCQSLPPTRTSEEGQEKGIYALSCLMGRPYLAGGQEVRQTRCFPPTLPHPQPLVPWSPE